MTKKIKELIKNFKPQFGNENHIRALNILDKMKQRDDLLVKKGRVKKEIEDEIEELDRELTLEERQLEFLMK